MNSIIKKISVKNQKINKMLAKKIMKLLNQIRIKRQK